METSPLLCLVVAVAENGIIGRDGDMPWQLSTDLKRFKAITMGKPIIMGRKTFESIGRPLPGRLNVVISRDANYKKGVFAEKDFQTATSLKDAIDLAQKALETSDENEICVIGGGEIYRQAMAFAQKLYVTHVLMSPEGDTSFPEIGEDWLQVQKENISKGEKDSADTSYVIYQRK